MAYAEFTGVLDAAPKASAPQAFTAFSGELDAPSEPVTPLGDPMGSGASEIMAQPTPEAGGGRGFVNPPMANDAPPPQTSGSTAKDLAINAFGGLAGGLAGAGAAFSSAFGAKDTAASLDQMRKNWEGVQKENGGDTITGKAASLVGAVAPALLVPEAKALQLVSNAGLFAIPAFRDTLNAQLEAGKSYPLAIAHAAESFGINLFLPTVATRGSGALVKALGAGESAGVKGAATALGQASAEGAGFSAVSSVLDKGTDLIAGEENDRPWIDPHDMAASALGFSAIRGGHMVRPATGAATDAILSKVAPNYQAAREMSRTLDAGELAPAQVGPDSNPNLAGAAVVRNGVTYHESGYERDYKTDPIAKIAKIAKATSVDEAIAAAQEAVATPKTDAILNIRPLKAPDVSASPDLSAVDTAASERGRAVEPISVESGVGDRGAERSAVDAGELRPEPESRTAPLADGGEQVAVEAAKPDPYHDADGLPIAKPYSEMSPAEQAGYDQRQGIKPGKREADAQALERIQAQTEAARKQVADIGPRGARTDVAPAATSQHFQFEQNPGGTLTVRGDKASIREALSHLPDGSLFAGKDGVTVNKTDAERAQRLLSEFDPTVHSELNGKKVRIEVTADDGTKATLKLDAGKAMRAVDMRERELDKLRECVGRA